MQQEGEIPLPGRKLLFADAGPRRQLWKGERGVRRQPMRPVLRGGVSDLAETVPTSAPPRTISETPRAAAIPKELPPEGRPLPKYRKRSVRAFRCRPIIGNGP